MNNEDYISDPFMTATNLAEFFLALYAAEQLTAQNKLSQALEIEEEKKESAKSP